VGHRDAGTGPEAFARVRDGLRTWAAHRSIGATVHPEGAEVVEGGTVLVALPVGPVTMVAPCRIVSVVDEEDRFGFVYGTLPGHPETGEERFSATLDLDGRVRVAVAVDARPGHPLVWLGYPVASWAQRRALRGYLDGLAACGKSDAG
jgi:uncharacterized protein (UPF0548 family)